MTDSTENKQPALIRHEQGLSWIAYPDERMQRASHAVTADGQVWVIDPIDRPGITEEITDLGSVGGVVLLLDRHQRDAETFAQEFDVPIYLPAQMTGLAESLDTAVRRFAGTLEETELETHTVVDQRFWQETALYHKPTATLIVPEAVGTASYFLAGEESLGVHPMLRALPPRSALGGFDPDRILVGHGHPVQADAGPALASALEGSRRRVPSLVADIVRDTLLNRS